MRDKKPIRWTFTTVPSLLPWKFPGCCHTVGSPSGGNRAKNPENPKQLDFTGQRTREEGARESERSGKSLDFSSACWPHMHEESSQG